MMLNRQATFLARATVAVVIVACASILLLRFQGNSGPSPSQPSPWFQRGSNVQVVQPTSKFNRTRLLSVLAAQQSNIVTTSVDAESGAILRAAQWNEQARRWMALTTPAVVSKRPEEPLKLRLSPARPLSTADVGRLQIDMRATGGDAGRLTWYTSSGVLDGAFTFPVGRETTKYEISGDGFYGTESIAHFEITFEDPATTTVALGAARLYGVDDVIPKSGTSIVRRSVKGDFRESLAIRAGHQTAIVIPSTSAAVLHFSVAVMKAGSLEASLSFREGGREPLVITETPSGDRWLEVRATLPQDRGPVTLHLSNTGKPGSVVFIGNPTVSSSDESDRVNVIFVLVDTLRADRLGTYGYGRPTSPNIDRLAAQSTVFTRCFAAATGTYAAVPSLLTGNFAQILGMNTPGQRIPTSISTLAEEFLKAGYATASVVGSPYGGRLTGLDRGFETTVEHLALSREPRAGEVLDRASDWIRALHNAPFFLYIHLVDPHEPYDPPKSYPELSGTSASDLYDSEVRYVDESIGSFLRPVLAQYQRTLVVLTSDHGEMLGEHGLSGHVNNPYQQVLHTPLIIYGPNVGVAATRIDVPVQGADIPVTIASLAGIPRSVTSDGEDLTQFDALTGKRLLHTMWPDTVVRWPYKYIRPGAAHPELLFDLERDPGEENNLTSSRNDLLGELSQAWVDLQTTMRRRQKNLVSSVPGNLLIDADSMKRLESLGYIAR